MSIIRQWLVETSIIMRANVSIVIPVFNEEDNILLAWNEVRDVMENTGRSFEVVFVDDGSTDRTKKRLREIASDHRVKLVLLRRNFGQTAAMHAGIQYSSGQYIVTMDGDLQNDPASIPGMLKKLDEGYDLVHGWRKSRQDKLISRKIPSWLANRLISRVTNFQIHDLGCTLKAIKCEIAKDIELYGEMHRFIPILANNLGARCIEVEVNHRPRQYGESKYGIGRFIRVLLDLITIKYMTKYFASPMKLFGMFGVIVGLLAMLSVTASVVMKLGWGIDLTGNALTFFAILNAILSVQFFSLGLIGELLVRVYFSTGDKRSYQVRDLVNFVASSSEHNTLIVESSEPSKEIVRAVSLEAG